MTIKNCATIQNGDHVKCFLRNSSIIEGIVEEWSSEQVVLKSFDNESLLIIHDPKQDILLTKIMLYVESEKLIPEENPTVPDLKQKVKEKLNEAQSLAGNTDLLNKTVIELKQLVVEQDKQIIAQKTKEHFGSSGHVKQTPYMNQSILFKKGKS